MFHRDQLVFGFISDGKYTGGAPSMIFHEKDAFCSQNTGCSELSRVGLQSSFNWSHLSLPASPATGHCPADWSQRSPLCQIQHEGRMKNAVSYLQAVRPAKTLQSLSLHLVITDLQGLRRGSCLG